MTVSLALRDHPKIPLWRRLNIKSLAASMGYRPNAMASALAYRRKNSIMHPISAELAWINHWQVPRQLRCHKEFDLYWRGAMQAAERGGFRLEEFVVDEQLTFSRLQRILHSRNIQGILLPPHGGKAVTQPTTSSLDWSRYSLIRFGYSLTDLPAHVVAGNQKQGTMLAFAEMSKKGYRRVGYVCHRHSSTHSQAGFLISQLTVVSKARLPLLELEVHQPDHPEQLLYWVRKYKPDAILTEIAELRALLAAVGYRVPQNLGLAVTSVLDGNADAGIYQNSEEIGRVAVETLVGLIHQNQTGIPGLSREILVEASWRDGSTLPSRNV